MSVANCLNRIAAHHRTSLNQSGHRFGSIKMLQACYPAEVSTSPLSCNDLRIPTSEVEFDLAHRQAQAVSKLYARLNGNTFGVAPTEAVGER